MRHRFLSNISIYIETSCCGFVCEEVTLKEECKGCGNINDPIAYQWFPDAAYEYAILLEDYHARPASEMRKQYFAAVYEDNMFDYFCSTTEPDFAPTDDWKPTTILLFRSLFELLLDHFLWKVMRVQLLPSQDAEAYADFVTNQFRDINARIGKAYAFVTNSKWNEDLQRLGFGDLNQLLKETADIRNDFIHKNPLAGHKSLGLADRAKFAVPQLFSLFVQLANEYHHPRAKTLQGIEIIQSNGH